MVTVLTGTMIIGILSILALIVIRFSSERPRFDLPTEITLPDGVHATGYTMSDGWYAVVTDSDEILIYDAGTNTLIQKIKVTRP